MQSGEYDYSIFHNNYSLPLTDTENRTKEQILLIATIHFAKNGYSTVTMRDIAKIVGIQQSSIYNHFRSKEILWQEVLDHASNLYLLYFDHLDQAMAQAESFEALLEVIFHEPKQMRNIFTCYAFSLVQAEQFRDESARKIFCETFLTYSIDFFQNWFDKCIARGMVTAFDTKTVATMIMNCTLLAIQVSVHEHQGHPHPGLYNSGAMMADLQRLILAAVGAQCTIEA